MRVLRVVVLHRNPFEIRSQILLHLFDQTARQARQLYPITEFRRDNQFKQPLVPRALPTFELRTMSIPSFSRLKPTAFASSSKVALSRAR
jgi:hypothetical protein